MSNICVIGVGHVGSVTGACLAGLGNQVVCLDTAEGRIEKLKQGILPVYEPGLEELVVRNLEMGRLAHTCDYAQSVADAEFAFIAVGTRFGNEGETDVQYVQAVARGIAGAMTGPLIVVNKSTGLIGTGGWGS